LYYIFKYLSNQSDLEKTKHIKTFYLLRSQGLFWQVELTRKQFRFVVIMIFSHVKNWTQLRRRCYCLRLTAAWFQQRI